MKDKERIDQIVADLAPELKEMSHKIHDNPELGNEEFKAYEWQLELIKKYGFEVEEHFDGLATGYRASYKRGKPGPKIAMCAEYDALPGLGHACGHNIICMIGVGSGLAMKEFADKYGGEIYIYGTPAEEADGAKVRYCNDGLFDDMDVVMMSHPANKSTDSWNSCALSGFMVEFHGKAAHAAAGPEDGKNALDAMILLFEGVGLLRQQTVDGTRIHGVIHNGGVVPGIIPDYTMAEFYTRANRISQCLDLNERIKHIAEGAALATGCTLNFDCPDGAYTDTISNQVLSRRATSYVEEQGIKCHWYNGTNAQGATDLGNVSYKAPAIQLMCGICEPDPGETGMSLHTEKLREAAGSDEGMETALKFVKAFTATAIDLMTEPEFLAEIKEEFKHVND